MPDSVFLLVLIFVASLALLVFASGKFINASEKLGLALGLPPFIIGVTVVALGTSLPELVSSVVAVLKGNSEIVVGNIVGSNITNILLIIGVTGVLGKTVWINFNFKKVSLPFLLGTAFFLLFIIWDLKIALWEGIALLLLCAAYIFLSLRKGSDLTDELPPKVTPNIILWLLLGSFGIYFGAQYNIESVIKIGEVLQIAPSIIALTAVALGTSLPELFVSLTAVRQGKGEIAIGNILGSNIYNIIAIGGISRLAGEIQVPIEIRSISIWIMLAATLLFVVMLWNKKVTRWEGVFLLVGYGLFLWFSFVS